MKNSALFIVLLYFLIISLGCGNSGNKTIFTDKFEMENRLTSSVITKKIQNFINTDYVEWLNNNMILSSIKASNENNSTRTVRQIKELDKKWREGDQIFMAPYLNNETSTFLKNLQNERSGLIEEIFIMDSQGCNVAQSTVTSDFWQGDEDKFTITYNNGQGKIFIDAVEYDDSTGKNLTQVSLPLYDPQFSKVTGTITIGINIEGL